MKRLTFFIAAMTFAALLQIRAADAPVTAAKSKAPSVEATAAVPANKQPLQQTAVVELRNKSSFQMEGNNRDPFWPIGWKPTAKLADAGAEHAGPDIPLNAFVVTSITIEHGGRYAIVNGKVMQEGQQFGLQLGNQTYQIKVKSIEDGRVVLARRDQEIAVPLRRK